MKIKFVVQVVKWFDKVNGNTYHSCRITRCWDGFVITAPFQYGYGDQYRWTARKLMLDVGWIPKRYASDTGGYERENKYPILWIERHGLKRECVENGRIE
jgi:hypothetical protein